MADYIDREKLLDDLSAAVDHHGMGEIIGQTLMRYVKRQPSVDAAPVVRCKNCKHWGDHVPFAGKKLGFRWCDKFCNNIIVENDYCSYGELRVGGDPDGR